MMIATHWQPSYTPGRVMVEYKAPIVREKRNYKTQNDSPMMMKIIEVLRCNPGVTAARIMNLANTTSANAYLRYLSETGLATFELYPLEGRPHLVKHFTLVGA